MKTRTSLPAALFLAALHPVDAQDIAFTNFEEAPVGATSYRGTGAVGAEVGWSLTGTGAVIDSLNGTPLASQQVHVNNGTFDLTTEAINIFGYNLVNVSVDFRIYQTSTGLENDDNVTFSFLLSDDGLTFDREVIYDRLEGTRTGASGTPGITPIESDFDPLLAPLDGPFESYRSSALDFTGGAAFLKVRIVTDNNSDSEHFFFDNIRVRGVEPRDDDDDGIPDLWETDNGLDPGLPADADADPDGDGLANRDEFRFLTDPRNPDTDGDGYRDGAETNTGTFASADDTGTHPLIADTDGDGLADGVETGTAVFVNAGDTGSDPNLADTDGDGLSDFAEVNGDPATDPSNADSDGDGVNDRNEIVAGFDPNDAGETPPPLLPVWTLGVDDNAHTEFSQESGGATTGGRADVLDDDYFFAGVYPRPVGRQIDPEPEANFERALTNGDPRNRIHFHLNAKQALPANLFQVSFDTIGAIALPAELTVSLNDNVVFTGMVTRTPQVIEAAFTGAQGAAVEGPNVLTVERTVTTGGRVQFDQITAGVRIIEDDDPNLAAPSGDIFGALGTNPGVTTAIIPVTNTGPAQTLNISRAEITGAQAGHFTVVSAPVSVAPGETAEIEVSFDPAGVEGRFGAALELDSDDPTDPTIVIDLSARVANTNGLLAHYRFDELEGGLAIDASSAGTHGQYSGASDVNNMTLIERGAVWRYLDDGTDQLSIATPFQAPGYDDAAWASGPAELGYGDAQVTTVGFGPSSTNKYPTTYFRHSFEVTDAADVVELTVFMLVDDGAVVHLNGREVLRDGMPAAPTNYLSFANFTAGTANGGETDYDEFPLDPLDLVEGTNVLAVEVHQANATSSDISFDLELVAGVAAPDDRTPFLLGQEGLATGTSVRLDPDNDGTVGFVTIPGSRIQPLESFGVSLWIHQDPAQAGVATLFSRDLGDPASLGDPFALVTLSGSLVWFAGALQVLTVDGVITPGTTQHVAASFQGGATPTITLYVDGVEVGSAGSPLFNDLSQPDLQIGALAGGLAFAGRVDEFQFYDRAIDAGEAAFLFANPGGSLGPADPFSLDSDGDGVSDGVELAAGTDPNDGNSRFAVFASSVNPATAEFSFSFPSAPGLTYTIEFKDEITSPTWTTLQAGLPASGAGTTTFTDTNPGGGGGGSRTHRFYRVRVE